VIRHAKAAGLIGLGVLIAVAGSWLWQQFLSRDAQIDSLHRACLADFADAAARLKAGVDAGGSATAIAKSISSSLARMLEGASEGVGDAVCSAVRDACRSDFDGRICSTARERYR